MENNNENEQQQKNIAVQKPETVKQLGESNATASLVLGIIGAVLGFTGLIPFVLGIIGLVQANKAKKLGCNNSSSTAGFVLSLISVILGGIVIIVVIFMFSSIFTMAALQASSV